MINFTNRFDPYQIPDNLALDLNAHCSKSKQCFLQREKIDYGLKIEELSPSLPLKAILYKTV